MHAEAHMHDHAKDGQHTEPAPSHLDAWHQHEAAEGTPREEHAAHANITVLLVAFVVITLGTLIFSVIIGVYTIGQFNRLKYDRETVGLSAMNLVARDYKRDALAAQEGYGWIDQERVRLPIEQAMRLVAQDSGGAQGAPGPAQQGSQTEGSPTAGSQTEGSQENHRP